MWINQVLDRLLKLTKTVWTIISLVGVDLIVLCPDYLSYSVTGARRTSSYPFCGSLYIGKR